MSANPGQLTDDQIVALVVSSDLRFPEGLRGALGLAGVCGLQRLASVLGIRSPGGYAPDTNLIAYSVGMPPKKREGFMEGWDEGIDGWKISTFVDREDPEYRAGHRLGVRAFQACREAGVL